MSDVFDDDKIEAAANEGLSSGSPIPLDLDAIARDARAAVEIEDADLMRRALASVEARQTSSGARWSQDRMAQAIGRKGGHVIREIMGRKRMMGPATRKALAFVLRDGPLSEDQAAEALLGQAGLDLMDGPTRRALAYERLHGPMDGAAQKALFDALPDATPKGGRSGRPPILSAAE